MLRSTRRQWDYSVWFSLSAFKGVNFLVLSSSWKDCSRQTYSMKVIAAKNDAIWRISTLRLKTSYPMRLMWIRQKLNRWSLCDVSWRNASISGASSTHCHPRAYQQRKHIVPRVRSGLYSSIWQLIRHLGAGLLSSLCFSQQSKIKSPLWRAPRWSARQKWKIWRLDSSKGVSSSFLSSQRLGVAKRELQAHCDDSS